MIKNILALSGSVRDSSTNMLILKYLSDTFGGSVHFEMYTGLAHLPHFDPDAEDDTVPGPVIDFRSRIQKSDGVLICTPEYVFSLPSILKNALEWTVATTLFLNKPVCLITASSLGAEAHASLLRIMDVLCSGVDPNCTLHIEGIKGKMKVTGTTIQIESDTRQNLLRVFTAFSSKEIINH